MSQAPVTRDGCWCPGCQQFTSWQPDAEGHWCCLLCRRKFDRISERRGLYHHLWGLATKAKGYIKSEWQHLASLLGIDDETKP